MPATSSCRPGHRRSVIATTVLALSAALVLMPVTAQAAPAGDQWGDSLTWGACPTDIAAPELTCSSVRVPLDYRHPHGTQISIAVSKLASPHPAKRRGVLLTNPGGPGGAGLVTPHDLVTLGLPQSVRDRYDVIGFDPRGVGHSAPVTCNLTVAQQTGTIPPYARTAADVVQQGAAAKQIAQQCGSSSTAAELPYITTANTARDMDRIRTALRQKKISYLGQSYGTYLGAVYTSLFPRHSDRIVLDSAVSPGGWDLDFQRRIARGFADRFPDFARYAASHPQYGLGRTPAAVIQTYYTVTERLDTTPTAQGITGSALRQLTFSNLYYDKDLPALATIWSLIAAGKPLPVPGGTTSVGTPTAAASQENYLASQLAVICDDSAWPGSIQTYADHVAVDRARYPMFGAATANVSPCAYWPNKPIQPRVRITSHGPSNVLIVQNQRDPITPLVGASQLRHAFGHRATLVTADQGGHLAYLAKNNSCLNNAATTFLVTGALPRHDVACRAQSS